MCSIHWYHIYDDRCSRCWLLFICMRATNHSSQKYTRATPCDSHRQGVILRVNIYTIGLNDKETILQVNVYHRFAVDENLNFKNNFDKNALLSCSTMCVLSIATTFVTISAAVVNFYSFVWAQPTTVVNQKQSLSNFIFWPKK